MKPRKQYNSVVDMVRDISDDPECVKDFDEHIRQKRRGEAMSSTLCSHCRALRDAWLACIETILFPPLKLVIHTLTKWVRRIR